MKNTTFLEDLEKVVDLGDPSQVQLYTDALYDNNFQLQQEKIIKLLFLIIQKSKTNQQNSDVPRLLAHLQHFVSILESFSLDSEILQIFTATKEGSKRQIPKSFFDAESERLKNFIQNYPDRQFIESFLADIRPEILEKKLQELRSIQNKVEASTDISELKNVFQEICTLFELSSLLNDRLMNKLSEMKQEHDKFIQDNEKLIKKSDNLQNKLKQKEEVAQRIIEIEGMVSKMKNQCETAENKSKGLLTENNKLKNEINGLKKKLQQQKLQNNSDQNLQSELSSLKEKMSKLEIENADLIGKNNRLKNQLNEEKDLKKDNVDYQEKLNSLRNEIKNLNELISSRDDFNSKLIEENRKLKTKIKNIGNYQNTDKNEINITSSNEIKQLKNHIEKLENSSHKLEEENKMLKNKIEELNQGNISDDSENSKSIKAMMRSLQKENKMLKKAVLKVNDINLELNSTKEQLRQEQEQRKITEIEKEKIVQASDNLKKEVINAKESIFQDLSAIKNENNRLMKEHELISHKFDKLKSKYATLLNNFNQTNSKNEYLKEQRKELRKFINKIQQKFSQQEESIDIISSEKEELLHENEKLSAKLKKLKLKGNEIVQASTEIANLYQQKLAESSENKEGQSNSKGSFLNSSGYSNDMSASQFALILSTALSEPIDLAHLRAEIFRLIEIVKRDHTKVSIAENNIHPVTSVPMLSPQFDDLDREIIKLQRSIKSTF